MNFGITNLPVIPVRKEASEKSEMVTQLLFGELYKINKIEDNWCNITINNDNYEGWIDKKMSYSITEDEFNTFISSDCIIIPELATITDESGSYLLSPGSCLYNYNENDNTFSILNNHYKLKNTPNNNNSISKTAKHFINTPYLWGGKNLFGMDCSGYSQVVFKILGFNIPRDAKDQVVSGSTISFISEAKEGDLAFFDNNEGDITHVGIMLNDKKIIHCSGHVRIDNIDHQGIYNETLKKYTHKLRIIKRIINS